MARLLDRSGIFICHLDKNRVFTFASDSFLKAHNLTLSDIQGKVLADLAWQPADGRSWSEIDALIPDNGELADLAVELPVSDGVPRRFLLSLQALEDSGGGFSGYYGTCRSLVPEDSGPDTDDLRRFRDLAHSGADWFWELDADLRISFLSESQEQVSGIPNSVFLGLERPQFEGVEHGDGLRSHLEDLEARRPFKDYTYPILNAEGNRHWFRVSGVPCFDDSGEFTGYRGVGRDITGEHDALIKIRRTEQLLLDALELTPIGLSLWDEDDRYVVSNSGLKQQMPEEIRKHMVPGIKFQDYTRIVAYSGFIPGAIGKEEEWVRNRLECHKGPSDVSWENNRADNSWVRVSVHKTRSGGVLDTYTDITQIKTREQELAQAQAQLRFALESIDQGFVIYDADDRLVLVNSAFRKMYPGDEKHLVQGTRFEDVIRAGAVGDQEEDVEGYVRMRLEQRASGKGNRVVQASDGTWRIVNSSRTRDGGTVSVWTDVTQLKEQEEALRDSESRFTIAFQSSPLMMAIVRLNGGSYVEVNDKFIELSGYDREELTGPDQSGNPELASYEDREKMRSMLMRGQAIDEMEVVLTRKNGEPLDVLVSGDLIEVGGEQRILMIAMDFSSHKRLEGSLISAKNEAELANRTKSEFLANMSHELRTPLNAVIGFSEFIANETFGPLGDERYLEYIGDIRDSGTHLLNLINDILDVSKVEAGKMDLRESDIDLDEMMERCIRSVGGRAREARLTITNNVVRGLPLVRCDETKMRQILINLLNNAVKFTDPGGNIEVGGEISDDGELRIYIKDDGIGIAAKDMEAVFNVFGQAEATSERRFEGAGLGLPLTRALVELHGGELYLESELGVGTTAFVRLPENRLVKLG